MKRETWVNVIGSVLAVAAIWLAWFVAYRAVGNDYVIPSAGDTFAETGRLLADAAFWLAFGSTFLRAAEAFALSFVLGLAFALLASSLRFLRAFLSPVVSVLRTVPTMALVLILLLWTSPAAAPVLIAVLVLFPAFYAQMLSSLDEVRATYGGMARVFRVGRAKQAFCMYLPLMAPPVLKQAGANFSLGLKITVSGEVLAVTAKSLGGMMQHAQGFLETPRLMALTLVAVLTGFLLEGAFFLLYKAVVRWRA